MANILVIEDNPANMKLAVLILESHGHIAISAENAIDGIQQAKERLPDLILMDIQLPDMDGLEATQLLKQDPKTKDIPVFAMTAFAMRGDEERILNAGCDGYIKKPIQYKHFLETITMALHVSRPE